jgi:hypothetical protein
MTPYAAAMTKLMATNVPLMQQVFQSNTKASVRRKLVHTMAKHTKMARVFRQAMAAIPVYAPMAKLVVQKSLAHRRSVVVVVVWLHAHKISIAINRAIVGPLMFRGSVNPNHRAAQQYTILCAVAMAKPIATHVWQPPWGFP